MSCLNLVSSSSYCFLPTWQDCRKHKDDELIDEEKSAICSLSGQLLWDAIQIWPNIAYDACIVKEPAVKNILMIKKTVKKVQSNNVWLVFPSLGGASRIGVLAYSDATHASLPSRASYTCLVILLASNDKVAPIMC